MNAAAFVLIIMSGLILVTALWIGELMQELRAAYDNLIGKITALQDKIVSLTSNEGILTADELNNAAAIVSGMTDILNTKFPTPPPAG